MTRSRTVVHAPVANSPVGSSSAPSGRRVDGAIPCRGCGLLRMCPVAPPNGARGRTRPRPEGR